MIIPLDPDNKEHRQAAADLHRSLLGDESPIPQLGERFCRDFYYGVLIRDGLLQCDLAVYQGHYIGWISYTAVPLNFLGQGLKTHLFLVSGIIALSVVSRPSLVRTIWRVFQDMKARGSQAEKPGSEPFGELLSLGVLEDSRQYRDPDSGERYSKALIAGAIANLRKQNLRKIQVAVRKWYKVVFMLYAPYNPKIIDRHYDFDRSYRLEFSI